MAILIGIIILAVLICGGIYFSSEHTDESTEQKDVQSRMNAGRDAGRRSGETYVTRNIPHNGEPRPLHSEDCLTPDEERSAIVLANGVPNIEFKTWNGRLVPTVPQGIVNPKSRNLYKYGLFIFNVRGTAYHKEAARRANTEPGAPARLSREPDNAYDVNAIAIYDENGVGPIGYVNKQNARRLAPRIDSGEAMTAFFLNGDRPNHMENTAQVAIMRYDLAHKLL